jgi:hypothetical protein
MAMYATPLGFDSRRIGVALPTYGVDRFLVRAVLDYGELLIFHTRNDVLD